MKSAVKSNGIAKNTVFAGSLLMPNVGDCVKSKLTIQQTLSKWYQLLNTSPEINSTEIHLFADLPSADIIKSLQTDIGLIPSLLMEEMIDSSVIYDKHQYIRLIQVLLVNISDLLILKNNTGFAETYQQIEKTIQFIEDFFYQQYDADCRITKYHLQEFLNCVLLKLDYWQLKLQSGSLIAALKECLADKFSLPEAGLTYRKVHFLKTLITQIELATTVITEEFIRELFIYNNFNAECFIEYEITLVKEKVGTLSNYTESILFLQTEKERVAGLKIKASSCFDIHQPSVKKQLADFITEEIKQVEIKNNKAANKDLLIDPESKIQTSLSVAKLAVLIRLMVIDKIIINKSVAPMLRTITKLFTTLQKDEISFGSLETKYHAPDKSTVNVMKEMLQKWVGIVGKL